jgi:hypothetical protein
MITNIKHKYLNNVQPETALSEDCHLWKSLEFCTLASLKVKTYGIANFLFTACDWDFFPLLYTRGGYSIRNTLVHPD